MPIYKTDGAGTPSQIGQVTVGPQNIAKVYFGSTLVFGGTQVFDLTNSTNVNLQTFLVGQSANTTSPIIINIASDQIIGSSDPATPAMVTGDLSGYQDVTLNNAGEIQGASNGGDAFVATTNLTINNTGAIRAGGGNGGNGGLGGYGTDLSGKNTPSYSFGYHEWWYGTTPATVFPSKWQGTNVFTNQNYSSTIRARKVGSYWYYPDGHYGGAQYGMGRGTEVVGTKGAGGTGGNGRGYGVSRTDGSAGAGGTWRAGNGGDGGDGGDWGQDGSAGSGGGIGYYWAQYNTSTSSGGASGTAGSAAGNAIDSGSATVTLIGGGVVNGDVL